MCRTKLFMRLCYHHNVYNWVPSGGPKDRQAKHHNFWNRTTCMHRNRNPCNSFFMVNLASGRDHGRVHPTTTNDDVGQHGGHPFDPANTKSCSLGLHHISLILDMHIMLNWQLSYQEIRWPISRDHIAGSGLELIKVACFLKLTAYWVLVFVRIAGSCQVNLLKTGLFGSQLTLTMVWNLTKLYLFLLYKCLLLLCFVYMVIIKTQTGGQTIYRKPHRKVKKLKSKLNIFLG